MRATLLGLCAVLSAVAAYYGQPFVRDNSDAILIIITVTTVFAGFLVAIITVLGDPAMIPDGSWRTGEIRRDLIEARLIRHYWLFVLYLVTISILFTGVLLRKACISENWKVWLERGYLFTGVFSFLLTLGLPGALIKFQVERIEAEIKRRRKKVGIKD